VSDHLTPSDRTFMRHFAIMIAALAAVAVGFVVIGLLVHASMPEQSDTAQIREAGERIVPIGADFAGSTGRAAMLAQQAAAAKAAASQVAYGGTTDGKTIYGNLCHSCHEAGVTGAPKLGNKGDWAPRIAEGVDTLVKHAIDGYTGPDGNHMPAKGGNPALTDAQVEATVKWMVSQVH
jgi:cytochrome c5